MPEKKKKVIGRTRALFNTGTRPHKSIKDYSRKVKHKGKVSKESESP